MKTALALCALFVGLSFCGVLAQPEPAGKKWDISHFDASKFPPASTQTDVTFDKDIAPLFKTSCLRCHGEERPRGGLKLDTREDLLKGGHDGEMVVVGDSAKSPLIGAISRVNPRLSMPPPQRRRGPPPGGTPGGPPPGGAPGASSAAGGPPPPPPASGENAPGGGNPPGGPNARNFPPPPPPLTPAQVGLVRAWIDQGAK